MKSLLAEELIKDFDFTERALWLIEELTKLRVGSFLSTPRQDFLLTVENEKISIFRQLTHQNIHQCECDLLRLKETKWGGDRLIILKKIKNPMLHKTASDLNLAEERPRKFLMK